MAGGRYADWRDAARQSRNQNPKSPQKNTRVTKEGKIMGEKPSAAFARKIVAKMSDVDG